MTKVKKNDAETNLIYDSFNRLIQMSDGSGSQQFVYQGMREIGTFAEGYFKTFRLIHPKANNELVFAIELEKTPYFPLQDYRYNICALQTKEGLLAQWYRHSAFALKSTHSANKRLLINPWNFANRRQIEGLSLFTHRFYHPKLKRWLTPDPIGFEDGLNLYAYVHNNPYRYNDPNGRFAIAIPIVITLVEFTFGSAISAPVWLPSITTAALAATAIFATSRVLQVVDGAINAEEKTDGDEEDEKRPPYCGLALGDDSTKCPGEGFEWKGKGTPESGHGSWVKTLPNGKEDSLHPDFKHGPPVGPHWDYKGDHFPDARLNLDGTWELK